MIAAALDMTPRQAAGRRTFALIAALLCLPFVVATVLWASGWRPDRQINHGEILLANHLPVRQVYAHNFQKNGRSAALLDGRWTLALAVPGECGADCMAQLSLARQVQVSLNKDMVRLARGLFGPQLHDTATVAARWPDLAIGHADDVAWRTLGGGAITAPQLFLIDPQGRLVLRYGATPDPKGIRRDVERLLKYSWNG